MGCYVNPPENGDKLEWLKKNGKPINAQFNYKKLEADKFPVALVFNMAFEAAGVAYCESEWEAFTDPTDPRLIKYFLVDKDKLEKVSPLKDYLK